MDTTWNLFLISSVKTTHKHLQWKEKRAVTLHWFIKRILVVDTVSLCSYWTHCNECQSVSGTIYNLDDTLQNKLLCSVYSVTSYVFVSSFSWLWVHCLLTSPLLLYLTLTSFFKFYYICVMLFSSLFFITSLIDHKWICQLFKMAS